MVIIVSLKIFICYCNLNTRTQFNRIKNRFVTSQSSRKYNMCLYLHHINFVYRKVAVCNTVLLTDCFSIDTPRNVQITIKSNCIKEKVLTHPSVVTMTTN